MARKLRVLVAGGIYHVTFRGNAQQDIFVDVRDRERLTERLAASAEDFGVRVYLYCWMSNHGHLLVETPGGNLSSFMASVLTGYTVYFNRRYGRVGHLMQGRFRSQVVSGDQYLLRLSRYIHLNPVEIEPWKSREREDRTRALRAYPWSSYRGYAGLGTPEPWICRDPILALVSGGDVSPSAYRRYVETGLADDDEMFVQELHGAALAVGPDVFRRRIILEHEKRAKERKSPEDVSFRAVRNGESADVVLAEVSAELGVPLEEFRRRRRDCSTRALAALGLVRRCLMTERAAAGHLGLGSGSAVSYLIRTLKRRAESDDLLAGRIRRLTERRVNSYFQG